MAPTNLGSVANCCVTIAAVFVVVFVYQIGHAMNTVLVEANERIKFPLRKLFINVISPSVSCSIALQLFLL